MQGSSKNSSRNQLYPDAAVFTILDSRNIPAPRMFAVAPGETVSPRCDGPQSAVAADTVERKDSERVEPQMNTDFHRFVFPAFRIRSSVNHRLRGLMRILFSDSSQAD
jgi:hypothetical protein